MRGWLLDIYPDYGTNSIVYWIRGRKGVRRIVDRAFLPIIYVGGARRALEELEDALPILEGVKRVGWDTKRTWLGEDPRELLAVTIGRYDKVEDVAHTIDNRGRYRDFSLFNVDLRFSQRYFFEKDLFPCGLMEFRPKPMMLEDPFEMDYELMPLSGAKLEVFVKADKAIPTFADRLVGASVDDDRVDGSEEHVLRGIEELLREKDPDVVYTDGGDSFAIPFLYRKAKELGLGKISLGREEERELRERKGKSYFTYGRIKYKPPSYKLRGRIHIDRTSSFMYDESGLAGLIDLSRISRVPLQELSRLSPGSAISAMEVDQALRDGCAIMWKKNLPEGFKTAEELVIADRGGFIYEPRVGIHDRVLEVDFTSLYPSIMVRFNISPETLMCSCCPEPFRRVPVLGYGICDKRAGLIPRVLKPVVERRTRLKKLIRSGAENSDIYRERVDILKWLLVTCLDSETEVPFRADGRFDVLPVADVVDMHGRRGVGELEVEKDLQLFGVDSALVPAVKHVSRAFRVPAPTEMVELETRDGSMKVTPDHPCYVMHGNHLELRMAEHLSAGDLLPMLLPMYSREARLGNYVSVRRIRSVRRSRPSSDHVYCFSVSEPLHGFALGNGILTHNCFGYTGYKNARFGRIECHESITAFGREIMLQASEIAEAHGFEILHGIVDSLWLKGTGDAERFCEHVSGHIGIPLDIEGTYDWIVFLPDRTHGVGVLNRYYGKFDDGRLKVRGIELRRRDTPGIVKDMQQDMLNLFSKASDAQQFIELVPNSLGILERYVEDVRSETVPLEKLMLTRSVSKVLGEYSQFNDNAAALIQLDHEGVDVSPGEAVRYVITDASSKDPERRVKVEPFVRGSEEYDVEEYVHMLLSGAEGMLLPFGYNLECLNALFEVKRRRGG